MSKLLRKRRARLKFELSTVKYNKKHTKRYARYRILLNAKKRFRIDSNKEATRKKFPGLPQLRDIRSKKLLNRRLLLLLKFGQQAGRNNQGKITVRARSASNRQKILLADSRRRFWNVHFREFGIFYDCSNRTFLSRLYLGEKLESMNLMCLQTRPIDLKTYISPQMKFASVFVEPYKMPPKYTYDTTLTKPLMLCNNNSRVYNVAGFVGSSAKYIRSPGTSGLIVNKYDLSDVRTVVAIRLPSDQVAYFSSNINATLGSIYAHKRRIKLYKAGQSRWLGFRPMVRGVAKNPVDHPHGGGEGKTSGGRPSVSPWGICTKGFKTLSRKRRMIRDQYTRKIRKMSVRYVKKKRPVLLF
jgi:large subunit ribosomal protein L2